MRLSTMDLKYYQIRLSLNKNDVKTFMIPLLEGEDVRKGFTMIIYDWEGYEYPMRFVLWSKKMYVLTSTGWRRFCREHQLRKNINILKIWMFRHKLTQKLALQSLVEGR
ncbi:hypothetical protein PTKIN_Ptkin07bG0249200 [Pterospermum kingtungense]